MTEIPGAGRPCGLEAEEDQDACRHPSWTQDEQGIMDLFERTDQALAWLEAGLPL